MLSATGQALLGHSVLWTCEKASLNLKVKSQHVSDVSEDNLGRECYNGVLLKVI